MTGACKFPEVIQAYKGISWVCLSTWPNHSNLFNEFPVWQIKVILIFSVPSASKTIYMTVMFDCLIIVTCITSFTLCTRSVINGIQLQFVSKLTWWWNTKCCVVSPDLSSTWKGQDWQGQDFVQLCWFSLRLLTCTISTQAKILTVSATSYIHHCHANIWDTCKRLSYTIWISGSFSHLHVWIPNMTV